MSEQATNPENPTIVTAIGEVLWDVFPTGARFGGAPANFACTVAGLCDDQTEVHMVSAVGQDELGSHAITALQQHHVRTESVAEQRQPTGRVLIALDDSGSASYQFEDNCAWDNLAWTEKTSALAKRCDAVCFGCLLYTSPSPRDPE